MSTARRADLEKRLLSLAAATNRGASARAADRDEVTAANKWGEVTVAVVKG